MLSALVRKEFLHQLLSSKFTIMLLLVLVLTVASALVMIRDYELRLENYELLKPTDNDIVAIKKPAPASILVKGLDERMGRSISVWSLGVLEVGTSQGAANRLFALFSQLDMQMIIVVIMSLAAVLFSFDMISGEKRFGTLKQMLANGVGRGKVLLAKWLAGLAVVGVPALLAFVLVVLMVQFLAPGAASGEFYVRAALLFVAAVLYLSVFVGIGLTISAVTRRPSISLIFAILVWALLVFVIPNGAALLARNLSGGGDVNLGEYRVRETWTREVFNMINQREAEGNDFQTMAGRTATILAENYRNHANMEKRRIGLLGLIGSLSPAGPFDFLAWGSAGTGPVDAVDYDEQVLRYQSDGAKDAVELRRIGELPEEERPADFQVGRFEYQPRDLAALMAGEYPLNAGLLVLMSALLFAVAFIAFTRYDVR